MKTLAVRGFIEGLTNNEEIVFSEEVELIPNPVLINSIGSDKSRGLPKDVSEKVREAVQELIESKGPRNWVTYLLLNEVTQLSRFYSHDFDGFTFSMEKIIDRMQVLTKIANRSSLIRRLVCWIYYKEV